MNGRRLIGALFTSLTGAATALIFLVLGIILFDVVRGGMGRLSWEFLTSAPREGMTEGGIFPALYGTAVLTLLMTIAVMPVGVLTAVYLHEYAPRDSRLAPDARVTAGHGVPAGRPV